MLTNKWMYFVIWLKQKCQPVPLFVSFESQILETATLVFYDSWKGFVVDGNRGILFLLMYEIDCLWMLFVNHVCGCY